MSICIVQPLFHTLFVIDISSSIKRKVSCLSNFLLNWLWLLILLVRYASVTGNWKLSKLLKLPLWLLLISLRLEVDLIKWALCNDLEILIGVLTLDRFSSLIKMFSPTYVVLVKKNIDVWTIFSQQGEAYLAYEILTLFEFVFIFHLVKEIMNIIDLFC